jgi:ABC-type amino acid transport substrate-binding protein
MKTISDKGSSDQCGRRLALTAVTAVLFLSGAAFAQGACLDDVRVRGVLTSGLGLMGVKPYVWRKGDKLVGFEWDMFQELGRRLRVPKVEYEVTEWSSLIPGLKAGKWDIVMSSMSVTQERIQGAGISFSRPYLIQYDLVVVNEGSKINSMSDLKGKRIGATLGSMESINAHRFIETGEAGGVADFNGMAEPFLALSNHQIDAVISDQLTFVAQKGNLSGLKSVGNPVPYRPKPGWEKREAEAGYALGSAAVGVRRECDDLRMAVNRALEDMEKDGTRESIFSKYGIWDDNQKNLVKAK